ncbi:hypothetical protein [Flavobacterium ardleyense]|uniref:hypothetical protein n=1 Tax=Flavobacterium ardleyense TaxID=2038737 RepID=UPI00298CC853|nr:hypothetical protein [Flavobacterium ardleyense]
MNKIKIVYGLLIGIISTVIGTALFLELFTEFSFVEGLRFSSSNGTIGKIITLGAILNILIFFTLLKLKQDLMARGVVLATILLAIMTLVL